MPSCDSRHQTRRFKALQNDPELLLLRPATAAAEFDDGEALWQVTDLMDVHAVTFPRLNPPSQGGPHRRGTASDRPATAYHGVTKAMKRSDLFDLCEAALEASAEPLDTRQPARHVITAESWDTDDRRLAIAIGHKVGAMMGRL